MRVLIVTNVYLVKSENVQIANFVMDQVNAMRKYCPDVEYTVFTIHGRDSRWNYITSIHKIRKIITSGGFDLVHIHYGLSGLFMLLPGKIDIPVVVTFHGGDIQIEQNHQIQVFLSKQIAKKCDAVITLNKKMDQIVRKYNQNTQIIPCSIDMDFFNPINRKVNKSVFKKIIFPSFQTRTVKNYPLFMATINILEKKYGIKTEEIVFNNISREQVRDYYMISDLVLLTSISEGSPGVVKEAMACNLPVVSTNVGDVAVNLEGVRNCAVASRMDAEELASLCAKCLNNEIEGKLGRDKIYELGLDDVSVCKNIYMLYNNLVKR